MIIPNLLYCLFVKVYRLQVAVSICLDDSTLFTFIYFCRGKGDHKRVPASIPSVAHALSLLLVNVVLISPHSSS